MTHPVYKCHIFCACRVFILFDHFVVVNFCYSDLISVLVTSGSCIPVFDEKYPMLTSGRATPLPKVRTEEDCKNACVTDMRCVAYQIDTNADRALCWIQLDKANLELDNMLEMVVKTVTEYILVNRCSDPGDDFQMF